MRRIFTILIVMLTFTVFAWGENYIWFPEENVYLESGAPKISTQKIYYNGDNPNWPGHDYLDALPEPEENPNQYYLSDYDYSYELLSGNLSNISVGVIEGVVGVTTTFDGDIGAIKITAHSAKYGEEFECSYVLHYGSSKKWDFNSVPYTVNGGSDWWDIGRHMANQDNHPYYIPFKHAIGYNDTGDKGPGAIIPKADGLRFETAGGSFGYNNPSANHYVMSPRKKWETDYSKDANCETRFICFKNGSKIYIPSSIFNQYTHPRVRIKMNRNGTNTLNLKVYNAKDAVGNVINTETADYGIGGCAWWGYKEYPAEFKNKFDYVYRGEYHFQIIDPKKDFCIEVASTNSEDWLMIYTIEVYDSEEMITENSVLGNRYQFLTTKFINDKNQVVLDKIDENGVFNVHFRGKAEKSTVSNCTTSGTVGTLGSYTGENFFKRFVSDDGTDTKHTYTPVKGEYGTFRIRLDVHTHGGNYVTDYTYRTMSCGVIENKIYPYTWDFTDIKPNQNKKFRSALGVEPAIEEKMPKEATKGYALEPDNYVDYEKGITFIPRNLWENDGGLRVANEAGNYNVMFCDGSQLWYGTTIIPETAGLAFLPNNFDGQYNGALKITDGGLRMDQDLISWWKWRIMVPQVDDDCTIYVRAKKLKADNDNFIVGYVYGNTGNKDPYSEFTTGELDGTARLVATVDDDVIYAIPGRKGTISNTEDKNVTLFFNGLEVHKIAVSKDPKKVNKYGWASESRDHVIDQELTSYFTGVPFETCAVKSVNYSKKEVALERVTMNSKVMDSANLSDQETSNDYNAYIIHNTTAVDDDHLDTKAVDILAKGDGFHLFVPDIHDYLKINENYPEGNCYNKKSIFVHEQTMKAALEKDTPVPFQNEDGTYNFVLSWQVVDIDHGVQDQNWHDFGYVGFFRVVDGGITSSGNQGYLPIDMSASSNTNKFNLVWADDANDANDINPITISSGNVANDNVFYNLNGQKINGMPSQRGLYIVNGKKIVIK